MVTDVRPYRAAPRVAAGLAVCSAAGLYLVDPNTTHVPLCPLHAMTGLWCPLCGSTRAGYALLHAHPGTALQDNALFVLGLPLLALFWLYWAGYRGPIRMPRGLRWTLLVLVLGFSVLRNLPAGSWLVPPA
jgi:hypothetical protein